MVLRCNPVPGLEDLTFSPWFSRLLQAFVQNEDHKQWLERIKWPNILSEGCGHSLPRLKLPDNFLHVAKIAIVHQEEGKILGLLAFKQEKKNS